MLVGPNDHERNYYFWPLFGLTISLWRTLQFANTMQRRKSDIMEMNILFRKIRCEHMKVQYIHGKANKIPDFLGRIKWNKCYK